MKMGQFATANVPAGFRGVNRAGMRTPMRRRKPNKEARVALMELRFQLGQDLFTGESQLGSDSYDGPLSPAAAASASGQVA